MAAVCAFEHKAGVACPFGCDEACMLTRRLRDDVEVPAAAAKAEILDAAQRVVVERGHHYGDVAENFARIARRWHAHLLNRFGVDVPLDAVSVALMMDDVKSARLEHQPDHRDSWVDKAGYAACGGEIAATSRAKD